MKNYKNAFIVIGVDGFSRFIMLLFLLSLKDSLTDYYYAELVTFISFTAVYQSIIEFGSANLGPRYTLDPDNNKEFDSLFFYRILGVIITSILILVLNYQNIQIYLFWMIAYLFFPDWILRSKFKIRTWSLIWLLVIIIGIYLSLYSLSILRLDLVIYTVRLLPIVLAALVGIVFFWTDWTSLFTSIKFEISTFSDALNYTLGALINRLNNNLGFLISGYYLTKKEISIIGYYLIIYNAISIFKSIISQALFPYTIIDKKNINLKNIIFLNLIITFVFIIILTLIYTLFKEQIIGFLGANEFDHEKLKFIYSPIILSVLFIFISFFNYVIIHSKVEFRIYKQIANRNSFSLIILLVFFLVNNVSLLYFTSFSLLLIEILNMIQTYYILFKNQQKI